MGPARLTDHEALALAFTPGAVLLFVLAAIDEISTISAISVAAAAAAGGWWFTKRVHPLPPKHAVPAVPPLKGLPEDIVEVFPEPVMLIGNTREIVGLNRAARDLLGIGRPGRDLAFSLRHPAVLAAVDTVFLGVPALSEEITLPVPVHRTFTLNVTRLPHHDDPTRPAVLLMLHDETRAKRAEQSRADFVANASHELRSPLAALLGMIETLRGPAKSDVEAQDRFLAIMCAEAQRMARLIDDLLSLSRVEINEHVPPRGKVDVADILEGIEATLGIRAEKRGMTIQIDCPPDISTVVGDGDQLVQVFHNLVDNALKYGRENTPVMVTVRGVKAIPGAGVPGVSIEVRDQGPGIPEVHLPRLTERFYRVDAGRSRKLGGTGLGLAIVKHIVNRHRGQLKVESKEGVGSTINVLLPSVEPPEKNNTNGRRY
ncbi:MAG: hypothetical protein KIT00_07930 [Rhodospirillales bacterium]|nr:hypothetical protein [Rhodospirillales bacterium]